MPMEPKNIGDEREFLPEPAVLTPVRHHVQVALHQAVHTTEHYVLRIQSNVKLIRTFHFHAEPEEPV